MLVQRSILASPCAGRRGLVCSAVPRVSLVQPSRQHAAQSCSGAAAISRRSAVRVLSAADTAAAATSTSAPPGGLLELNQGTFYQYLEDAGDTLVVVDYFTDWCGPCKVIYPELVKLAAARPDIRVVKFNCNKQNKELGIKLGIKVAPTFHLYKNSVKVAEMTGARMEQLMALIDKALAPPEEEAAGGEAAAQ